MAIVNNSLMYYVLSIQRVGGVIVGPVRYCTSIDCFFLSLSLGE